MDDHTQDAGLEPVLTTSQLAAHLGVPVQTIYDLRYAGGGPNGFRVGRELRYRISEVRLWLGQLEADRLARRARVAPGMDEGVDR
ncbi:MAG: helix-turn-helix domain-containing protein [Acidobacteria bacterium]|nr:helix-turn-helix domain-containing protein [Acidobacteriota bacterium]